MCSSDSKAEHTHAFAMLGAAVASVSALVRKSVRNVLPSVTPSSCASPPVAW